MKVYDLYQRGRPERARTLAAELRQTVPERWSALDRYRAEELIEDPIDEDEADEMWHRLNVADLGVALRACSGGSWAVTTTGDHLLIERVELTNDWAEAEQRYFDLVEDLLEEHDLRGWDYSDVGRCVAAGGVLLPKAPDAEFDMWRIFV
ncbi:hypothetical protein IDM40_08430 [Nocardiopsis sp. HNM0947]|uniref:Uncharacterized protein n=1 Tax=Nocardiopsis coralli TaxID=2772213 RepID=A0ABR9P4G2_9ACTN|nr:hypothetical protein [Nocardiopsis coralli]MBE2998727.1 hypothetical protein [Nocardiopsis coralli]